MKILSAKKITEIDILTTHLHDYIHTMRNDSLEKVIEKRNCIYKINEIRTICELPEIVSLIQFHPMPEVKPPKKEECKHVFEIGFYANSSPFLFCKHCAKTIELSVGKKQEGEA
jgi:hypothetical protein